MTNYERTKLDVAFMEFTKHNFEKPADCKNLSQLRYYVEELCMKIQEYETKFQYVPEWAYSLLAQYNQRQNKLILRDFQTSYS